MPIVSCQICRSDFYSKPNWIKHGWGKYCSMECKRIGQKNGVFKNCFICGKKTYKTQKDLRKSKSGKFFCSKSCQTLWRNKIVFVGQNHANWKGGEFTYRNAILRTNKPQICKRCQFEDKRVLVVHHLDKNRMNNDPANLIWLCANCHMLIHHDINEMRQFMEALV